MKTPCALRADLTAFVQIWYNISIMLNGEVIKRLIKRVKNWQVKFKLSEGA